MKNFKDAQKHLSSLGMSLKKTEDGEHRVNFHRGDEKTAYYTSDLHDAVSTGKAMKEHQQSHWGKGNGDD